MSHAGKLLGMDEPAAAWVENAAGRSPFLVLCDHAGRRVPRALGDLGVPAGEMERHIAWDIGGHAVSTLLGQALDAVVIGQTYSRLVVDCNRAPGHAGSMPPVSDGTRIPGNEGLSDEARAARLGEVFWPYHAAITSELDRRLEADQPTVVLSMHSFTPVFGGVARPWEAGILHDRNPAFALLVGDGLRAAGFHVGDNEPYQLSDESDYTVPIHAEARSLPYVELEVRQDLIADGEGQQRWAALLADVLPAAWATFRQRGT